MIFIHCPDTGDYGIYAAEVDVNDDDHGIFESPTLNHKGEHFTYYVETPRFGFDLTPRSNKESYNENS